MLVPEDSRIESLLNLDQSDLRSLLPRSPVHDGEDIVLFDYHNRIVRLIVQTLKYKNNLQIKKRVASYLKEEIVDISSDIVLFSGQPPLVVPMPMSKTERKEKGFNQCEELAKEIKIQSDGEILICCNVLVKIRETKRQTELGRAERLINVDKSMDVPDNSKIKGRTIIVLDDVYTTRATFSEARRALLSAGAKRVIGLFIAH